jgi:hypothetical protein
MAGGSNPRDEHFRFTETMSRYPASSILAAYYSYSDLHVSEES